MIQNTRAADRYGSWLITSSIKPLKGSMAFLTAQRTSPGCEVDPCSLSLVLMLDESRPSGGRRNGRMFAMTRLNAGLFVGGDHKIVGSQGLSLPQAMVEIEDGACFFHKPRIARKDPTSMPPKDRSHPY